MNRDPSDLLAELVSADLRIKELEAENQQLRELVAANMHKDSTTDRGKSNLGEVVGGTLSPRWVEWLMGFPGGWTDLDV